MDVKTVPASKNIVWKFIPARYMLAILGAIAMAIVYGLKVNLSVAIVAMINYTSVDQEEHVLKSICNNSLEGDSVVKQEGPFAWTGPTQGLLLSSYFWGYIVAQMPGGYIAENFSAKWVMFFSVAINVVATLLSPIAARIHVAFLIFLRVCEGIGGGVTFPGMHVLLAHWAPPNERSVMSNIVYAGTSLGTVISMLLSGVLATELGWEYVFYVQGGLAAIWLLLWIILIADTPQSQKYISDKERDMIVSSLKVEGDDEHKKHPRFPWSAVLKSASFWAILIAHLCSNWGWYMVLIELPTYLKTALNFRLESNTFLTAFPFFSMWVFSMILSKILDVLRSKNKITTTCARKTATFIASAIPLGCFITIIFLGCNSTLVVVFMTIAITAVGGMFSGFLSNHIDLSPNFAGTLVAITNTVATIPGISVPIFVHKLTNDPNWGIMEAWHLIFWVTIGLYVIEILAYMIMGSGEEQYWNRPQGDGSESQPLRANPK